MTRVQLAGDCFVSSPNAPASENTGPLLIRNHVDCTTGAKLVSLRILELAGPGSLASSYANETADEVLFVLSGSGKAHFHHAQRSCEICKDSAFYLPPRERLTLETSAQGGLVLASARHRAPQTDESGPPMPVQQQSNEKPDFATAVHLADQARETSLDRWFSTMVGSEQGSNKLTQFIGSVPPGRPAPHFHFYEEVICILSGHGRFWTGKEHAALEPGSCIYLPARQVHILENTGDDELRLLGVFSPAGSPADAVELGE